VLVLSRRIPDTGCGGSEVDCNEANESVHIVELNEVLIDDGDALWGDKVVKEANWAGSVIYGGSQPMALHTV
jgi:hypothetical protein